MYFERFSEHPYCTTPVTILDRDDYAKKELFPYFEGPSRKIIWEMRKD